MMVDCLAFGEVMLRFDPGDTRIAAATTFKVWEGGGEYNVARGLSQCFGKRTAIATALVDNEIGRLIEHRIASGGVRTDFINWLPFDGIGESCRNGIYFLEKGFGLRPAMGVSDRGHSAVAQLRPGQIDWEYIFGDCGVKWFHTGGIMAGLSHASMDGVLEAMQSARRHGVTVSYDLNYRPSLWQRFGGKKKAKAVTRTLLPHVDVLLGIEELEGSPESLETDLFSTAISKTVEAHPQLKTIASTMRIVKSASRNDWSGLLWHKGAFFEGARFEDMELYDRVGAGDAFAAGVIYGLLENLPLQKVVDYGVAHGALTMTTPGDNSMVTVAELDRLLTAADAGVLR